MGIAPERSLNPQLKASKFLLTVASVICSKILNRRRIVAYHKIGGELITPSQRSPLQKRHCNYLQINALVVNSELRNLTNLISSILKPKTIYDGEHFDSKKGFRQGYNLLCEFFNLYWR